MSENSTKSPSAKSVSNVVQKIVFNAQAEIIARRTATACIGVYLTLASIAFALFKTPEFWIAVPVVFSGTLLFSILFFTPFNFLRTLGAAAAGFYAYIFYCAQKPLEASVIFAYFLILSILTFKMSAKKSMCWLLCSIAILMYAAYRINLELL